MRYRQGSLCWLSFMQMRCNVGCTWVHAYISALTRNRWRVPKDRAMTRRLRLPCWDIASTDDVGPSAEDMVLPGYCVYGNPGDMRLQSRGDGRCASHVQ